VSETDRHEYDRATIKRGLAVFLRRFFETSQFKRSALSNAPKVGSGGSLSPRSGRAPSDGHAARITLKGRVGTLPVLDATGHLAGVLSIDDILLRAVGEEDGIAPADFLSAMRVICAGPSVEPEVEEDKLR
jgi:hypothetical protein